MKQFCWQTHHAGNPLARNPASSTTRALNKPLASHRVYSSSRLEFHELPSSMRNRYEICLFTLTDFVPVGQFGKAPIGNRDLE